MILYSTSDKISLCKLVWGKLDIKRMLLVMSQCQDRLGIINLDLGRQDTGCLDWGRLGIINKVCIVQIGHLGKGLGQAGQQAVQREAEHD